MKMKILFLLILFISVNANADTLGVRITGGSWSTAYSGYIRDSSNEIDQVDLEKDLALKDKSQTFFYAYIEHPIPIIPNIRIGKTGLSTTGNGILTQSYTFSGTTYVASEAVTSTFNLDHSDITLYWSILDNYVGLDIGINAKTFTNGELVITGATSGTASTKFNDTIPMVYVAIDVELPLTGLSLGANGSFLSVGSASLTDFMTFVRYESPIKLGIEAGLRTFQFNYDDSPVKTEIKASGAYINGFIHF